MPKTRDAFAFRVLYNSCLMWASASYSMVEFIPDFAAGRKYESLDEYDNDSANVEDALLSYLDGGEIKYVDRDLSEFDKTKESLTLDKKRISNIRDVEGKTERHIVRLQNYSQQLFNRIIEDGLNERFKLKGERVRRLTRQYEYLLFLFKIYEEFMLKEWRKHEDTFQREYRKEFGRRLRQARIQKNFSTTDIAKQLGLSRVGYGYYELGQRDMPTPTIYRLAEFLDVSTDWLFGLKKVNTTL